jgi:hypothetical protein
MAFVLKDRVRMTTATTGTGAISLGTAVVNAAQGYFRTFAVAGVANGDTVPYLIEDGVNWETGVGTYASSGTVLTRTTVINNSAGTTSPISLSGSAEVAIVVTEQVMGLLLRNDLKGQQLSGGARLTLPTALTLSGATISIDPGNGPLQPVSNNGAGSIVPGAYYGVGIFEVINVTGAGSITTTGWTVKGDSFDTTVGSEFLCSYAISANMAVLNILKVA